MGSLAQLSQKLRPLRSRSNLYQIVFDLVRRYENVFVNLQKQQLSQGQDIFGNTIGEYSQLTEQIAQLENPRKPKIAGEPYNFEWTGNFFDGIRLEVRRDTAIFSSSDSKTPLLVAQYGDIFGLSDENLTEVVSRVLLPALQFRICEVLGLNA